MTDVDAILTGARLPEDTVAVCTRQDLVAQWSRLGRELASAQVKNAADPRLAGGDATALVERMEALRVEVEASTVEFRVRALAPKKWSELVEEHPPREGDEDDLRMEVNRETFLPELVKRSTVEPTLLPETWAKLLDPEAELLSRPQWGRLWRACWNLNVKEMDVPFSVAGLLTTRVSGSESGSPEPSV